MDSSIRPNGTRRRAIRKSLRLARRLHLYFGLFLLPWVCLYGTTALLFNHPDWMHDRSLVIFGEAPFAESALSEPPDARALAASVHAALPGTLSAPENIRWVGRYRLRGVDDHNRYTVYAQPDGQAGVLYATPLDKRGTHPLESLDSIDVPFGLAEPASWSTVEAQLEVSGLAMDRAPELLFDVREGDVAWRIEFSPLSGAVQATRLDERPTLPTIRQFLLQLHTQHVYSGAGGARSLWAVLVDLMGTAMLLWSMTGLLMWWQLKRVRRVGGVVILVGAASMVLLAGSLYFSLGF